MRLPGTKALISFSSSYKIHYIFFLIYFLFHCVQNQLVTDAISAKRHSIGKEGNVPLCVDDLQKLPELRFIIDTKNIL